MSDTHELEIRVRYQETDGQRRVHHANFLTYFEIGRTEMLRSHGHTYRAFEDAGLFMVVSEARCHYHGPAEYDDLLLLRTRVEKIGAAHEGPPAPGLDARLRRPACRGATLSRRSRCRCPRPRGRDGPP